MNNIKYNVIIVIFVLIFIGYFYLENNVFTYKNVKTKENFQTITNKSNITNSMLKTVLENFFENMKSINNNLDNMITEQINIQNLIKKNEFIFLNIVKDSKFVKHLSKITSYLNKNNRLLNNSINELGSYINVSYLNKLKALFSLYKITTNDYRLYYKSDFSFKEGDNKTNNKILSDKIELEGKLIKNHQNIKNTIENIQEDLPKLGVPKNVYTIIENFLEFERNKNELYMQLHSVMGLFTVIDEFNNIYKNDINISRIQGRNMNDKNIQTKELLTSISTLINNENKYIYNSTRFDLMEEIKENREIEYLYSSNNNNNVLANFCKKIKKLDKPSEGNLITQRLHKEFKKKKEHQIKKLEVEIDKLINSMTEDEMTKYNTYVMRTHDQASKQYEAINKAKENLENAKKLKINIS